MCGCIGVVFGGRQDKTKEGQREALEVETGRPRGQLKGRFMGVVKEEVRFVGGSN